MSRKIISNLHKSSTKIYFPKPLVERQYKVIPPPPVPKHIKKPSYLFQTPPIYGIYSGRPTVHSPDAILKLKKAAKIASNTLHACQNFIKAKYSSASNLTEQEIDQFVFNHIIQQGAYPTPIGFMKFPKSVCVSVNQCIVHGIPTERKLQQGDKINIDVTVYVDGYHGDNNLTVLFGPPRFQEMKDIVNLTQKSLYEAIKICRPGVKYREIGQTIQKFANKNGLHVCEFFTGHGVGNLLHMPPQVFHVSKIFGKVDYPQFEETMEIGHVFTIQPILTLFPTSQNNLKIWDDQFTTISPNNPNAQFQHTLLIVENGCEVLTKRIDQII